MYHNCIFIKYCIFVILRSFFNSQKKITATIVKFNFLKLKKGSSFIFTYAMNHVKHIAKILITIYKSFY